MSKMVVIVEGDSTEIMTVKAAVLDASLEGGLNVKVEFAEPIEVLTNLAHRHITVFTVCPYCEREVETEVNWPC